MAATVFDEWNRFSFFFYLPVTDCMGEGAISPLKALSVFDLV